MISASASKRRSPRRRTPASAPVPVLNLDLAAFVRAIGAKKHGPRTVAVCYYLEEKQGVRPLTASEVRRAYLSIPLRPPQNLPRLLNKLAEDGHLVRPHRDKPEYILSDPARSTFSDGAPTGGSDPTQALVTHLRQEIGGISDKDERDYLEEAMVCLQGTAFRAAVVMGWTAAIWNLRRKAASRGFAAFNAEFSRRWPQSKKKPVQNLHGFENYRDEEFLQVIEGAGIISKSVLGELSTHLKLRNSCGHPTAVRPRMNRVAAFFEDILQYILAVA